MKINGSPKFAIARVGLKIAGRLSRGIELGWRTVSIPVFRSIMFTKMSHAAVGFGRLIDKSYLNASAGAAFASAKQSGKGAS